MAKMARAYRVSAVLGKLCGDFAASVRSIIRGCAEKVRECVGAASDSEHRKNSETKRQQSH
jgi:hypothetical protein